MDIKKVNLNDDLSAVINVLNKAHGTVAQEYNFTKESNPSNSAFINQETLKEEMGRGIDVFFLSVNNAMVGCIAIEKSKRADDIFYIEKVSVLPEHRHYGYGVVLMDFATDRIKSLKGKTISIGLIDSNTPLKNWYTTLGYTETGFKDFDHLPFRVCFMAKEL
jgi:ribosomal protein S18 acetylase RimI-like enzyme